MNLDTLSIKLIIDKFDLQEQTVTIQWKVRKEHLWLFATKLTKKYLILAKLNTLKFFFEKKKHKTNITIKNNYSATKNF